MSGFGRVPYPLIFSSPAVGQYSLNGDDRRLPGFVYTSSKFCSRDALHAMVLERLVSELRALTARAFPPGSDIGGVRWPRRSGICLKPEGILADSVVG